MTMLSNPDRKQKIEHALNQCGAVNARFEAAPREIMVDPDKEKKDENNLNHLIDMFGRDKVQIDE